MSVHVEPYDLRTAAFVLGTVTSTIAGPVPENMTLLIHVAKYSLGGQSGTIVGKLMQSRAGTITGTVDVVTLAGGNVLNVQEGSVSEIVGVVEPGHFLVGIAEPSGSVMGKIIYSYTYGRTSRS